MLTYKYTEFITLNVLDLTFYVSALITERAAKVAEQQERDRAHHHTSPRAGTPVRALMGVVPSPIPMGMLNPSMTPVSGNPW